jgi:hypothetical protein
MDSNGSCWFINASLRNERPSGHGRNIWSRPLDDSARAHELTEAVTSICNEHRRFIDDIASRKRRWISQLCTLSHNRNFTFPNPKMTLAFNLHPILLDIPRNAVLAIGMPLVLGSLSGLPTAKVVNGPWYKVFGAIVTLKVHVQFQS